MVRVGFSLIQNHFITNVRPSFQGESFLHWRDLKTRLSASAELGRWSLTSRFIQRLLAPVLCSVLFSSSRCFIISITYHRHLFPKVNLHSAAENLLVLVGWKHTHTYVAISHLMHSLTFYSIFLPKKRWEGWYVAVSAIFLTSWETSGPPLHAVQTQLYLGAGGRCSC